MFFFFFQLSGSHLSALSLRLSIEWIRAERERERGWVCFDCVRLGTLVPSVGASSSRISKCTVCVVVLYCILLNSVSLGRGRPRRRWSRRQRRGGDGFLCLLCTLTTAADALTARRVSKRASVSYEDVRGANPSQSFSSINDAVKRQWRHPHSLVLKSNSKVTTPSAFIVFFSFFCVHHFHFWTVHCLLLNQLSTWKRIESWRQVWTACTHTLTHLLKSMKKGGNWGGGGENLKALNRIIYVGGRSPMDGALFLSRFLLFYWKAGVATPHSNLPLDI